MEAAAKNNDDKTSASGGAASTSSAMNVGSSSNSSYIRELAELQKKVFGLNLELHQAKSDYKEEKSQRLTLSNRIQELEEELEEVREENEELRETQEELLEDRKTLLERDEAYGRAVTYVRGEFNNVVKHLKKMGKETINLQTELNRPYDTGGFFGVGVDEKKVDACANMLDRLDFALVILNTTTESLEELLCESALPPPTLPVLEYQDDNQQQTEEGEESVDETGQDESETGNDSEDDDSSSEADEDGTSSDDDGEDYETTRERTRERNRRRPSVLQSAFQSFGASIGMFSTRNSMTADAFASEDELFDSIPYEAQTSKEQEEEQQKQHEQEMEGLVRELFFSHQLQFAEFMETRSTTTTTAKNKRRQYTEFAKSKLEQHQKLQQQERRQQRQQKYQQQQQQEGSVGQPTVLQ